MSDENVDDENSRSISLNGDVSVDHSENMAPVCAVVENCATEITDDNALKNSANTTSNGDEGSLVNDPSLVRSSPERQTHTEPSQSSPSHTSMSKLKFRVSNIFFPGDEISHPKLVEVMSEAQCFHMWFEREQNKHRSVKRGAISLTFDDENSARLAYFKLKDLTINGVKLKVHGHKSYEEQKAQTETGKVLEDPVVNKEDEDRERFQKLYVYQLLPNEVLIKAIFGNDNVKNIEIRPDERVADGSKCVIVTFHDRETAEQAKLEYDGFMVDDGEASTPIRIMLYTDYLNGHEYDGSAITKSAGEDDLNDTNASLRQQNQPKGKAGSLWSAQIAENRGEPAPPVTNNQRQANQTDELSPKPSLSTNQSEAKIEQNVEQTHQDFPTEQNVFVPHTGELSADELRAVIEWVVERDRINWAELQNVEELWTFVHKVSKEIAWQPEASWKEAVAAALDAAFRKTEIEWLKIHLGHLVKLWRKELENDARSRHRKQLLLQETADADPTANAVVHPVAIPYTPVPLEDGSRKRNKKSKKALMQMMGVGALLADVQKEVADKKQQKLAQKMEEKRKRKHSASESGEASTTTSEDEEEIAEAKFPSRQPVVVKESSDEEEGTATSSEDRRHRRMKRSRERSATRRQQKHQAAKRKPLPSEATLTSAATQQAATVPNWMNNMTSTSAAGGSNMQQWMAQMMPMMMPMMAQMMQMRMMATANQQPQQNAQQQMMQQFQQQMMQMFQQMNNANAAVPPPPSPQQQHSSAASNAQQQAMLTWMQRMMASGGQGSGMAQYQAQFARQQQQPPPPPSSSTYPFPGHKNFSMR